MKLLLLLIHIYMFCFEKGYKDTCNIIYEKDVNHVIRITEIEPCTNI